LHKETNGVWLLNAGIVIEEDATLYVNSTDTSWLKIVADGETAYPMQVSGSLDSNGNKIDLGEMNMQEVSSDVSNSSSD
jgi:mannuronan 5-epimerase